MPRLETSLPAAEHVLQAALRGVRRPEGDVPVDELVAAACRHGVAALVLDRVSASRAEGWPRELLDALSSRAIVAAVAGERRRAELARLLDVFRDAGIDTLLMKGVPLAYSHYARPGLRPAIDTDILFRPEDDARFDEVLRGFGYDRVAVGCGQSTYRRVDEVGSAHVLDCHWFLSGRTVSPRAFGFEELRARSVPVPALGDRARALGPVDALILAGIHFAHHWGQERLVWLYDVHLLASRLDTEERALLVRLAREKRVRAVCARVLTLAEERFGRALPGNFVDELLGGLRLARLREPSAAYLPGPMPIVFESIATFRNMESWEARRRFVRQLLLPDEFVTGASPMTKARVVTRRFVKGILRYVLQGKPVSRGRNRAA